MKKISSLIFLCLCILNNAAGQKVKKRTSSKSQSFEATYVTPIGTRSDFKEMTIPKSQLLVQKGVNCYGILEGAEAPCGVIKYSLLIISDQKVIFSANTTGPFFTEEMKSAFKNLKAGDLLVVYDITIQRPKDVKKVPAFVYEIK